MAFVKEDGPVDIVEASALALYKSQKNKFSCVAHRCDGCLLEVARMPKFKFTCALRNVEDYGTLEGTTRKQKEILACIAIFGRYPIEEEK